MAWIEGNQPITKRKDKIERVNESIAKLEGFLSDEKAQYELVKFLRSNISFTTRVVSGVDLFPFQEIAVKTMMKRDYTLCVWSRGLSKTFTAAIFVFLHAIFSPGSKIAIISRTFRQAREIFKRVEDIANHPSGSLLAECFSKQTKHMTDQWQMNIGSSEIIALPLGSGEKLRGFRFNCIVIDELLLMPEKILNEVILPFLAVVSDPKKRQETYDQETELIKSGLMTEDERKVYPNSKLVGLSSASYQFEYLYTMFKTYVDKIKSGIEKDENGNEIPLKGSYAVLQYPYEVAPSQLYDKSLINKSRSEMSKSQFDREFGAKFTEDSSGFYNLRALEACSTPPGEYPVIEIKGDPNGEYVLAIDPSYAQNESSDFFAMTILKRLPENKFIMVHSYAVAGSSLQNHLFYFYYLITNFNVRFIIMDNAGGIQFLDSANQSKLFNDNNIKLEEIKGVDFENVTDYQGELQKARSIYNNEKKKIVYMQTFNSQWLRRANELMQANIDYKRLRFAGNAQDVEAAYTSMIKEEIPIGNLNFLGSKDFEEDGGFKDVDFSIDEGYATDAKNEAKKIDLIERQDFLIRLTKTQCALIEPRTNENGVMTWGLPDELKKQKGANKTRRDLYTSLLLANWAMKCYNDLMSTPVVEEVDDWVPRAM